MKVVFWLVLIIVLTLGIFSHAHAHDMAHPEDDAWYESLMQPDYPLVPCCGEADAYWADSFEQQDGQYVAIITDDRDDKLLHDRRHIDIGTKFVVPNYKIKWDQGNPTGHGVIFVNRGDYVLCYVPPGGV